MVPLMQAALPFCSAFVLSRAIDRARHVFAGWYSPPAYANTPEDRAGWAVVASGVGLVFILLFASIRLYTRYPFRSRLLYDDVAIIVSTIFAIIQSSLVIVAASHGLGKAANIVAPGVELPTEKVKNLSKPARPS